MSLAWFWSANKIIPDRSESVKELTSVLFSNDKRLCYLFFKKPNVVFNKESYICVFTFRVYPAYLIWRVARRFVTVGGHTLRESILPLLVTFSEGMPSKGHETSGNTPYPVRGLYPKIKNTSIVMACESF
jgi:hypothetical protein